MNPAVHQEGHVLLVPRSGIEPKVSASTPSKEENKGFNGVFPN